MHETGQIRPTLRRATRADSARLLEWRNDPDSVRYSTTQRTVTEAEHARWFSRALDDEAVRVWIAEADSIPVGQVRVDVRDGVGVVSIAVAAGARGSGYGSRILEALIHEISGDAAVQRLIAAVHPENAASLRIFERAGFHRDTAEPGGFVTLAWP